VALRRSFGFKLDRADGLLHQFVAHLQSQHPVDLRVRSLGTEC
jgi:hypothetical protein